MKEPVGLQKKSFLLYYGGGEIWAEHLDGLYGYTNLAIEKFEKDYLECKRPSLPASARTASGASGIMRYSR